MYFDDENNYRYTRDDLVKDDVETKKTVHYTPYDQFDEKKNKKEKKEGGKKGGFVFFAKVVAAALVFGIVAGLAFNGTNFIANEIGGGDNGSGLAVLEGSESGEDDSNAASADSSASAKASQNYVTEVVSATALDVSQVVENFMPSIVSISCITNVNYFGMTAEANSAGSGIILAETDDLIYIGTNNHVISGANSISVSFIDGTTATAEVKGTDADNDLAVVCVNKEDISQETYQQIAVAEIGDSDDLKVGQTAIAIGNALGYGQSVTTGVISALNREVTVENVTNELIQTDAAINPGNSGGALIDASGRLIGINSAKYSDTSVEGMGYAIPIATAMPIIENLIEREVVEESKSAYLGVSGVDVTSDVAQMYNMPEGLYVSKVYAGSAAETCGLQQGDIITSFDGHKISSMSDLKDIIQYYEAGTQISLTIQRVGQEGYEEIELDVTLGKKAN